jgi:16S rRNA (guanine527-N7)-methyltransferase
MPEASPVRSREEDTLRAALGRHRIELPDAQVELLDRYVRLLWQWNETLNLTRHTTYDKFVGRDCCDALELCRLLETGERVLDVGTGGGLPGVILAIVRPDVAVSLCDSVGKKARALEQIVRQLGLDTPVYAARVQDLLVDHHFDTLIVRAVGPLWKVLSWLAPHWGQFERVLLIKGPKWIEERNEARHRGVLRGLRLSRVGSYPLSGTESQSVILEARAKHDAKRS